MESASHATSENHVQRLAALDKSSIPADGGQEFNRLIFSRSPYLLQHAENPVDWYPWCDEAFDRARNEDKPIFLSIGYATCHWCHVMAHECFEDVAVAAYLNEHFIAIKVDREERPDLDDQYMTVAQLLTGGGGWPLTLVLTPEKRPFFAATYLPKFASENTPSLEDVLSQIVVYWKENRDTVEENCRQIIADLHKTIQPSAGTLQWQEISGRAFQALMTAYDVEWKGFGVEPKFPLAVNCSFLVQFWKRSRAVNALWMVEDTIAAIRRGGVYDQIGFGVHRYAVDRQWLVPHFEKMLYDQAMLAHACLDAYRATHEQRYRTVAEEIFSFVRDSLTSPSGGFYSALDADSGMGEGHYYLWTPEEFTEVLGASDATICANLFGVEARGNFEGRSILHMPRSLDKFAAEEGSSLSELENNIPQWRAKLFDARNLRITPFRDEKVITCWNGLMISALAKGYALTGVAEYRHAAEKAVEFVSNSLSDLSGRLYRSCYLGNVSVPAFLEDYAALVWGLLELYNATLRQEHLKMAEKYAKEMIRLFQDSEQYGLFDTAAETGDVLVRKKSGHDGVIPSGNSMAAFVLIKLGKITQNQRLLQEGEGILRAFMGTIAESPLTSLNFIMALDFLTAEEVIATFSGEVHSSKAQEFLAEINRCSIPGLVLRVAQEPSADKDEVAVGFCSKGVCRLPVKHRKDLMALLNELD